MSINDVVVLGLGMNNGQIGFVPTLGFGQLTDSSASIPPGIGIGDQTQIVMPEAHERMTRIVLSEIVGPVRIYP